MNEQVAVNGSEVWAHVVELDGGLRVRLDLSDWERMGLYRGQRVPVRRPGRPDEWLSERCSTGTGSVSASARSAVPQIAVSDRSDVSVKPRRVGVSSATQTKLPARFAPLKSTP